MDERTGLRSLTAALFLVALGGCAPLGPDFSPPDPLLPSASFSGKPEPANPERPPGASPLAGDNNLDPRWWAAFRDPILTSLAERVSAANLDVNTATVRLVESRLQRNVTASALFPAVNGATSYQRELFSQNGLVGLIRSPTGGPIVVPPLSVWQTGLDASWEIDFWGRIRRQIEAAEADAEASEDQRRDALVSSLAELARDYIDLRGAQTQIAIAKANLASSTDIANLTKIRAEKGLTTGLDVENAAAEVENVRSQLPPLQAQENQLINALSLLLDEPPGALSGELARAKPVPPTPPRAPLGVPSELARRRPDIRRAEAQLHSATAEIGVAVADFYPSVKLNGSLDLNALNLNKLWMASSLQYMFGPTVSLPIFQGGRLKSTLELRTAQQQEAAIAYHKTVLQAWHDVVNALVAYRKEQERRKSLQAQVQHSRQALALARSRYVAGVADFLTVLDAERTLFQAELAEAQSRTSVSTDFVQLYKALGGGWELAFPEREEKEGVSLLSAFQQ